MAHAALPPLLPTPPKWKMLPMLPTPPCVAAAILPKLLAKPGRADADERWDARKTMTTKPASADKPSAPRSVDGVRSSSAAGNGSPRKNNATSPPPPKPGRRADSVERWDAHKKASASSPSSSSSGKWTISRASSAERWDVHKKQCCPPQDAKLLDDGGEGESSSSTGSTDDIVDTEEEEILWKPRAMYAGPGFVVAAPEPNLIPTMPAAAFLVPVA